MEELLTYTDRYVLILFRVVGAIAFLPIGEGLGSVGKKSGFALLGTGILATSLPPTLFPLQAISLLSVLSAFMVGLVVALPTLLWVYGLGWCGSLTDVQRGQHLHAIMDPMSTEEEPISAVLIRSYVWAYGVGVGGCTLLLDGLYRSYEIAHLNSLTELGLQLLQLTSTNLINALTIFLPIGGVILVAEIVQGIIQKLLSGAPNNTPLPFLLRSIPACMLLVGIVVHGAHQPPREVLRILLP
jgi:flagellar biosynthesis protein FliR